MELRAIAVGTLTESQREAIQHPAGRLQILACAGSGKTEVLARRAVRALLEARDASSIIAFTFTERAAEELKARIEARAAEADPAFAELPPVARGMFIGTTHAWAFRALQDLGGPYGTVDALTEEQEWALLHRVARRLGIVQLYAALQGEASNRVATAQAVDLFLRSAEVVHNERIERAVLREQAPRFAAVLERYEELLAQMRLVPYRLMLARAVDELEPGGRLRERLNGRVSHVFVDEFQDFNRTQDRLLSRLAGLGARVTVVGDDDQAIYQWRGGDVSIFASFPERSGAQVIHLARNHRCRPEIVEFASHVVAPLPGRLAKALEAARERSPEGAVEVLVADTPEDEARLVAARIEKLLRAGHRPADIGVLYRSVRTSARPLVEELRARQIPVAVVGKTSLLAHPEMALVARVFVWWAGGTWYPNSDFEPEVVSEPLLRHEISLTTGCDTASAERALRRLSQLGQHIRHQGVSDIVALFNEVLGVLGLPRSTEQATYQELGLGRMSELLTRFDHAIRRAAPAELYRLPAVEHEAVGEAQEDAALSSPPAALAEGPTSGPARILGATRGEVYLMRLKAFLEEFAGRAAEETPETSPEAGNAVQIMTVHQAKGLEFPIVFVPSLVEGRFPAARTGRPQSWLVPSQLFDRQRYEGREEDEARLLYVAFTRARELLVVSWFRGYANRRAAVCRFIRRYPREAFARLASAGQITPRPLPPLRSPEPVTLDFSSLVTYSECGFRYWLRHVCGFQPPLVPELGFGRLLHHIVAELARGAAAGRLPSEADVEALVDRHFYLPFAGAIPASRLREAAIRRARSYVRGHGGELGRTLRAEARFEVPLAGARIRGRVDLLLRAEGESGRKVELVDFKTSANRPPSDVHVNQLRLYAAALKRMGYEPVRLAIHDLDADDGSRLEVPDDGRARDAFVERLQSWVDGIRRQSYPAVSSVALCRSCDFRTICRFAPAQATPR